MQAKKKFKQPPKKYQPKGLKIIYEDHDILVVDKAAGLLTMANDKESERTAYFLLTNYVRKGNPKARTRLFIVHRLDRETSGVLVFAKTEPAKAKKGCFPFSHFPIISAEGVPRLRRGERPFTSLVVRSAA